ncbi:MAG: hypothetical protein ACYCO0_04895 [Candidatus Micrarchaeaceae archaeon]
MSFSIPNIYTNKNLKFFIAIPIVLMIIGIYLSQYIVLDSSLSGGVSITLQTSTNMSARQISSALSSRLKIPSPTVQTSSGQVQITIAANKSLAAAENYLLLLYHYHSNYTGAVVNATNYKIALIRNPNNQTLITLLNQTQAIQNSSMSQIKSYYLLEVQMLKPFLGSSKSANLSNADAMLASAQDYYTNASNVYKNNTVSGVASVVPFTSYSYQEITVQQSAFFLQQLQTIIITAFILISIVVFFIFRSVVPSFAVVFGAANDMIVALGAMALFQIPLGVASIGGLLMLLGYSIDTDVLTAIRIMKRHEGTPEERAYSSMKTGLTMTATAIVAFGVLFAVSYIEYVPTFYEISGVVLFGLIGDLATTWLGNASMILLYVKRKKGA